jgi:hypothetical protein
MIDFSTILEFGFLTSLIESLWVLSTLVLSRSPCCIPLYSTPTYTQEREIKHIRINLSLSTWFFFVSFSSLSKLEGISMILTWATLPWAGNNGSFHYMTKTSLLIYATSSLWFNRDWHLEICDSPWLVWYLGFKHPLALLHHIRYLDVKTPACFSPMYGSLQPSPC